MFSMHQIPLHLKAIVSLIVTNGEQGVSQSANIGVGDLLLPASVAEPDWRSAVGARQSLVMLAASSPVLFLAVTCNIHSPPGILEPPIGIQNRAQTATTHSPKVPNLFSCCAVHVLLSSGHRPSNFREILSTARSFLSFIRAVEQSATVPEQF